MKILRFHKTLYDVDLNYYVNPFLHIYAHISWTNCVDPDQPAHPCHCSLFDLLGHFWPKCEQCRSWSDGTNVPADPRWPYHVVCDAIVWYNGKKDNTDAIHRSLVSILLVHHFRRNSVHSKGKVIHYPWSSIHLCLWLMANTEIEW